MVDVAGRRNMAVGPLQRPLGFPNQIQIQIQKSSWREIETEARCITYPKRSQIPNDVTELKSATQILKNRLGDFWPFPSYGAT